MAAAAAAPSTRRLLPPPAPAFAVFLAIIAAAAVVSGQRITTIQLDGTQYFVSRMNPYSPELNYFLAYQYCRSLGLQLASFESREKADSLMQYLRNAGYNKFDYWTSGNRLGTDMLLWMSTGAPFNTTFDYMRRSPSEEIPEAAEGAPTASHGPAPSAAAPAPGPVPAPATRAGLGRARSRRPGRQSAEEVATGCVALKSPALDWDTDDCLQLKDFICEQTRCYYYNYGSIPVSTSQGDKKARPTSAPASASSPAASSAPAASTATPAADETVHRRITVRPQTDDAATPASTPAAASAVAPASGPDPDPYPTELPSAAEDLPQAEEDAAEEDSAREDETPDESFNFASRSFPEKDAVANVVYVTAVGAEALNATGQYAGAATAATAATAAEAVTAEGPAEAASAAAPTAAVDDVPPKAEDATPALPPAAAAAAKRLFARGRVEPVQLQD